MLDIKQRLASLQSTTSEKPGKKEDPKRHIERSTWDAGKETRSSE